MRPDRVVDALLLLLCCIWPLTSVADDIVTGSSRLSIDVSRADGRIAMDLLGDIWILPARGGQAVLAADSNQQASRPRWSPEGKRILYQVTSGEVAGFWLLDTDDAESTRVNSPTANDQFASWHPEGDRIVYASAGNNSNFDIWETDIPTGLSWRLTDDPGDEYEPAWSSNGRDLAFIRKHEDQYALMLRRKGQAVTLLMQSDEPLSSLAWRPDGTLLTYLRDRDGEKISEMIILSEPPLVREFTSEENLFESPVSWQDRDQHFYTADGQIRKRAFGDWRSRPLPFRAFVPSPETRSPKVVASRQLSVIDPSTERLVIRGARLFDGIWSTYREQLDILIEGGKIVAIEPRREWQDATVLDLGDVTILPGLIDTWSNIPAGSQLKAGLTMLAYGVTTIVSDQVSESLDPLLWEGEVSPGPRLLPALNIAADSTVDEGATIFLASIAPATKDNEEQSASAASLRARGVPVVADNWRTHVNADADMLLGINSMPRFSLEERGTGSQESIRTSTTSAELITVISGLADATTPGIDALLESRQARELQQTATPTRRHSVMPRFISPTATILLGSRPNGLPAGMALHAELRALQAAGLSGEQVLHTAGRNPAKALGLENQIGTITPGALADMILVSGDPLNDVDDMLKIVAVIRNGRFFSLVRILEQAAVPPGVE